MELFFNRILNFRPIFSLAAAAAAVASKSFVALGTYSKKKSFEKESAAAAEGSCFNPLYLSGRNKAPITFHMLLLKKTTYCHIAGFFTALTLVMFFDKSSKNSPKCIPIHFTALNKCSCVLVEPERQMNHNA